MTYDETNDVRMSRTRVMNAQAARAIQLSEDLAQNIKDAAAALGYVAIRNDRTEKSLRHDIN